MGNVWREQFHHFFKITSSFISELLYDLAAALATVLVQHRSIKKQFFSKTLNKIKNIFYLYNILNIIN